MSRLSFFVSSAKIRKERMVLKMNNESMANFICERRKSKNLTQKQLAEQLNITDKAVSKWERGVGYPDITVLTKLAKILGVTTNELLNGSRDESSLPEDETMIQNTLQYAGKVTMTNNKKAQNIIKFILTMLSVLAILVCVICDLAIAKALTWSLYPLVSIVFAWLVVMPLFSFKDNKITISLTSLCIFIIPFLFCIEQISRTTGWLLPLGIPISIASSVWLWLIFYLFKKMENKWYASSVTLVMFLGLRMIINAVASRFLSEPFFDVWDVISNGIVAVVVIILFTVGSSRNRK